MKCIISSFMLCVLLAACSTTDKDNMLHIREQGSFLVGGSVVTAPGTYDKNNPTTPDGQALHGDHAYVFYQIPDKARCLPLVFLHGNGESAKTWETTPGWLSAIKNPHVCAIIAYEPGSGFVFPADELPAPIPHCGPEKVLVADPVSKEEFMKLTRIPIVIYYGDNIPEQPSEHWGQDTWRARLEMAHLFTDCINRHGGDAQVVHLPDLGIKGNTHFPFSDLNNLEVADVMSAWMEEKGLDN